MHLTCQHTAAHPPDGKTLPERRRRLAAAVAAGASGGGPRLLTQQAPAWVRSHPVFRLAMERLAKDEEGGLTVAQAAAADQAYAQAGGEAVQGAAAKGTVAAFLYGQNLVDSGGDSGVIDMDEVSFTAVVTGVDAARKLVYLDRAVPFPITPGLGWRAFVSRDSPNLAEVGIEGMTIRFRHFKAQMHHAERGFNAVQFQGASNAWARDLVIQNADAGIFFSWVDRSTITGVTVDVTASRIDPRWPDALNGHHALALQEGHGRMLSRFNVAAPFIHDVTLASSTSLNVVMQGRGFDLNFDHHRTAPWANLVADINLGAGSRAFKSGGNSAMGAHSGILNTYWNLRAPGGKPVALPDCDWGAKLNFRGNFAGDRCPGKDWQVVPLAAGAPPNLYLAQRMERVRRAVSAGRKALVRRRSG